MDTNSTLTFLSLISKYRIVIPVIQRDYAQGRNTQQIKEIRRNFLKNINYALINKSPLSLDFIYGSIQNEDVLTPLDGQQRLTTLYLLHWYALAKERKMTDFKELMEKFSYETRISSREFCSCLITHADSLAILPDAIVSNEIKNSAWFFSYWQYDPTIKAMLIMIDAIHTTFSGFSDSLWDILANQDNPLINFQFMALENFGLDDNLYIKMNARGKELTVFENFKASLQKVLSDFELKEMLPKNFALNFMNKMDNKWLDLFWGYSNEESSADALFMNFIKSILALTCMANEDIGDKRDAFRYITGQSISVSHMAENKLIFPEAIVFLNDILNVLTDGKERRLAKYLEKDSIINEEKMFQSIIKDDLIFEDRVLQWLYYQYLVLESKSLDTINLQQWIRIAFNLSSNVVFDLSSFISSIESGNDYLIPNRNNILKYLSIKDNKVAAFNQTQVKEEQIKANLVLLGEEWESLVLILEQQPYLRGQIMFLLDFSGILSYWDSRKKIDWTSAEKDECFNALENYGYKALKILGENGIDIGENLWRRALLCQGNYTMSKASNNSFCINGDDRDISWKSFFADSEVRLFAKSVFDIFSVKDTQQVVEEKLTNYIEQSLININDWRKYFVKYTDLIENGCGSKKYIRYMDENNILLLYGERVSGYCKELNSYALYLEILATWECKLILWYRSDYGWNESDNDYKRHLAFLDNDDYYIYYVAFSPDKDKWVYCYDGDKKFLYFNTMEEVLAQLQKDSVLSVKDDIGN